MKIEKISIKNFRSIVNCDFIFNDLLILIGKNNNGKSNIIDAIEMLLFKNKASGFYDFNNIDQPIELEAIFYNLTEFEKEKLTSYLEQDKFILRKKFSYKEKENGEFDSEGKMFYVKDGEEKSTRPLNIFTGETLPEFYKVPAVKELKEETKIAGTTYFGKFLDLVFGSDGYDFDNLDSLLSQIKTELERTDENAPLVKSAKEIEEIMRQQFKDCGLSFKIETPRRKDLINQLNIFADDGSHTPLSAKGHGTQRAFIFSILLLYAQKLNQKIGQTEGKDKKDIIIAIEEPEIYLHPQQQKIVYNLFKKLISNADEQIQIVYTTHSSFMVNAEDYKHLAFVSKEDEETGTKVTQCLDEVFTGDEKKEFKLACQFDPERNEMFFADKIILCEGDTEKYSLPILFEKLGLNIIEQRISIVECGSKNGIPLFQKVLNKFNESEHKFDYCVFYDLDIPARKFKDASHKQELEAAALIANGNISQLSDSNAIFVFNPDFEGHLSLEIGDSDKPYNARKSLIPKNENELPEDFKLFIRNNFEQ